MASCRTNFLCTLCLYLFNKLKKVICFWQKYQDSLNTAEYPAYQLIHLGHLEIHISLSNLNNDVRILTQHHCVVIISLSMLWTCHWMNIKSTMCKPLLIMIRQEIEWIEWSFFYAYSQYFGVIVMMGSQREGSSTNLTLQRGRLLDKRHSFESVLALHLQKSTWLPNSCHLKIFPGSSKSLC